VENVRVIFSGAYHFQPHDNDKYKPLIAIVYTYIETKVRFFTLRGQLPGAQKWHNWELLEIPIEIALEFGHFIPLVPSGHRYFSLGPESGFNGDGLQTVPVSRHRTVQPERNGDGHNRNGEHGHESGGQILRNGIQCGRSGKRPEQHGDELCSSSTATNESATSSTNEPSGESSPRSPARRRLARRERSIRS